jgi:aspartate 1-decarboxylase
MNCFRRMLRAKIHRVTVTHADVDYEGSLTVPPSLLEASDIKEYEAISVWNVTTGARFETYAIKGTQERTICVNGAAAHLAVPGDSIIIAAFADVPEELVNEFKPLLVFVDQNNRVTQLRAEAPGPLLY